MKIAKIGLLGVIVTVVVLFFVFDLHTHLTFDNLKIQREVIQNYYSSNQILTLFGFFIFYVLVTAVSLPGALILTLVGGALFGPCVGTGVIVLAATLGATLAMLSARFIFRDVLEKKYETFLRKINAGVNKNAINYVFFTRCVPIFPFFILNIVYGLTRINLRQFIIGTFIGMFPATFIYANAGNQIANLNSVKDIASPQMLFAFTLLGCLALVPVIYKKLAHPKDHKEMPDRSDFPDDE